MRKRSLPLIAVGICFLLISIALPLAAQEGGATPMPAPFFTATPLPELAGPILAGDGPDNANIFLYDAASGATRELTFGLGRQWFGSFSPNGCRFVFTMSDPADGLMRLYTARIDGADQRELLTFTDPTNALSWETWSPRWSPAGDRIAFVMIRYYPGENGEVERQTHVAWVSPDGGEPTFYSVSGGESQPTWSPDGSSLAYVSFEERVPGANPASTAEPTPVGNVSPAGSLLREADIWVVGADGQNKRRLTEFPTGSAIFPRWSPDGLIIGFVYAPTGNNHQFWVVPAQGGAYRQLSYAWTLVLAFDWLPDGSGFVASMMDWRGYADNLLWTIPLSGDADNASTLYLDDPNVTAVDFPAFSADGRYLGFRSAYSTLLYDTSNGDLRELIDVGRSNGPLTWSPAGFAGESMCP